MNEFSAAIELWFGILQSDSCTKRYQELLINLFWETLNGYPIVRLRAK